MTWHRKQPSDSLAAFAARSPAAWSGGRSAPPRPSGDELESAIEDLLGELPEDFDGAEEAGARVAVAWRIARAIAESKGHIAGHDDPLSAASVEAWSDPAAPTYVQGQRPGRDAAWRAEVERASVALLPTPDTASEWAEVAWAVAVRLDVLGTLDGRLGVLSLLAMLDDPAEPEWAEVPDREAVLELEESLVVYTMMVATVSPDSGDDDREVASVHKARRRLADGFGLAPSEVESLLALAQQRSLEAMPTGDSLRSMQLLQLDDMARRAASALDLGAEATARRLFAQVSGVTRTVPEDAAMEFLAVVKRVSARQDAELAEATTFDDLPVPSQREEVQPVILERDEPDPLDDPDDLAEFDRENE